ncbi:MAG: peptidase caspase catalytic subunit p20 [Rhizobium sp.]|nr:peptidase caspase catalytic subunit p20 [Rhizobium sp.]
MTVERLAIFLVMTLTLAVLIFPRLAQASEGRRVALVIGNSAYQNVVALPNPGNDAKAMAETLTKLRFKVFAYQDLNYNDMRKAVRDFAAASAGAEIGLIYFAGHGMEMDKKNYLIPIDATLASDRDVDFEALPLELVLNALEGSARLKMVLLDACRNNPFLKDMKRSVASRSIRRGLAVVEPSEGMLVSYSAKDGETASDGDGVHSPYTQALLDTMVKPGVEINLIFRIVRDEVLAKTGKQQEPYVYASLPKDPVYFIDPPAVVPPVVVTEGDKSGQVTPPETNIVVPVDMEEQARKAFELIKDSKDPGDFDMLAELYPDTFSGRVAKNRAVSMRQELAALEIEKAAKVPENTGAESSPQAHEEAAAVVVEQPSWYFARFTGADLYGGDLVPKGIKMSDASECATQCGANLSCRAFTFNHEQNRCFLKSGYEFVQLVSGVTSGLYLKAKPSEVNPVLQAQWELFLKSDLSGDDIGEYSARTFRDCMQGCKSTMGCNGFAWVYFTKRDQCWLKNGMSLSPVYSNNARRGIVSARVVNQIVRPDFVQPAYAKD